MYALSLSNLLIVNVWTNLFGTFEGTQYSILTKIMEMSVKMFKHESTKMILFCLRDFNDESDYIPDIEKQLNVEVSRIWDGIKKPANLERVSCDKFFKVELHAIRKFKPNTANTNFLEDIASLRKRLVDKTDPKYIMKNFDSKFNLPLNDLPTLSKNVWDTIIHEKEFNLPNEKQQVSSFRCKSIRDEVLVKVEVHLKELKSTNVGPALESINNEAIADYEAKAVNYDRGISSLVLEDLKTAISVRVDQVLDTLAKAKKDELVAKFEHET